MLAFACQLNTTWENPTENLKKIRATLARAEPPRGSIVVLPEMATTGFSMTLSGLAEPPGGTSELHLASLAAKHEVFLIAGLAVAIPDSSQAHNQLLCFDPAGKIVSRYTKLHPFSLASEQDRFPAGNRIDSFPAAGFKISPFICYDLRFPEVFRAASEAGSQLFVVSANWLEFRQEHWTILARARAIENQAYVIAVNRVGSDPHFNYLGGSMIIDPNGTVLASSGAHEQTISAEISPETVTRFRDELPFLADRRPTPPQLS